MTIYLILVIRNFSCQRTPLFRYVISVSCSGGHAIVKYVTKMDDHDYIREGNVATLGRAYM
jgi:hypothetical protein